MKTAAILLAVVVLTACGGGNSTPTAPTPTPSVAAPAPVPTPTPAPPAIARVTVVGVVTDANTNRALGGATVSVTSTTNTSTTDGNGFYSIPGVAVGTVTLTIVAANYNRAVESFTLPAADTKRDVRIVPFWKVSGTGNSVFDMPSYVERVRIQGVWLQRDTSNFIVHLRGRSLVNEILRTSISYDGTHVSTGGGTVEIVNSNAITWTFTQTQ